jgi:hypothetical protein
MGKKTREEFLDRLDNCWQNLIERFQGLPPQEQDAYLKKQGYATLPDLLAHVCSWWQDGTQEISRMRADPAHPFRNYDVDPFNAEAVKKFSGVGQAQVFQTYTSQRQAMVDLVNNLTADELDQTNINTRLYYEIIQHWAEHELN